MRYIGDQVLIIVSIPKSTNIKYQEESMELGAFSVSLAVKDLEVSKAFYEKLGFQVFAGDAAQNWLIMKNGDHTIELFQGMKFENEADESTIGPASFVVIDPDGNPILIDQHV
jgi:lactoylglutathione lyase